MHESLDPCYGRNQAPRHVRFGRSPAVVRAGAAAPAPTLHPTLRRSPLLIAAGPGAAAEGLTEGIAEQCQTAGVRCRVRTVDGCRDLELARYPGLVVVLPELTADMAVRPALEPCADVVADYRKRWPHGLADLGTDRVDPLDVGVVQLAGVRALLHNPTSTRTNAPSEPLATPSAPTSEHRGPQMVPNVEAHKPRTRSCQSNTKAR